MRFPQFLVISALVGLAGLAATYAFRSDNLDQMPTVSAHEQALQQEIERLRQTNDKLSADINRLPVNRDQPPAVHTLPPKPGMPPTTAAPALAATSGSPSMDNESPTPTVRQIIMNHPTQKQLDAVKPTPEQSAFFESMKQRLDDPSFVRALNLSDLTKMEEMKTLPEPLRQALLAKAVDKYNRGDVDAATFLSGTPGYQP